MIPYLFEINWQNFCVGGHKSGQVVLYVLLNQASPNLIGQLESGSVIQITDPEPKNIFERLI